MLKFVGSQVRTLTLAGAVVFAAGANGAWAADATADTASSWDLSLGVGFTSNYMSRGHTQTDDKPAVQPWLEFGNGLFYTGYWGSNVTDGWENDLSVGIRPTLGPFDTDFGYVRYIYSDGSASGEAYAKASFSPIDPLTIGGALYYDPDSEASYYEANGKFAFHDHFAISGAFGETSGGEDSWNAGLTWSPEDFLSVDGRYYGGPEGAKFAVTVSVSTSVTVFKK